MFLVKKKNVGLFFMAKSTLNHPGQEKFGLVPPPLPSWLKRCSVGILSKGGRRGRGGEFF